MAAQQLMPGAANWVKRGNRNMLGGAPRATHHITWDALRKDGTRLITLDGVSNYLLDVGYEPHVVIDPFTGQARQLLEASSSGFALQNTGTQTNRRGTVNLQVEWFFTPGTVFEGRRYDALTDTPMRGLQEFLAWCDGWDIPRVAPLAPKDRNATVWAGTAGHYGHFNAPGNSHTDPIVSIRSILDKAGSAPPPAPKEDQVFSRSPVYTVHIIASHSGLLLTSTGAQHGAGVVQRPADGSLNQRWEVWGHDNGEISLVNRAGGFALDRPDYSTEAGTALQVARTEHNAAQRWALEQLKPHLARLWTPGTNRLVDIRGRSADAGAEAQLWIGLPEERDPRNQHFVFAPTV